MGLWGKGEGTKRKRDKEERKVSKSLFSGWQHIISFMTFAAMEGLVCINVSTYEFRHVNSFIILWDISVMSVIKTRLAAIRPMTESSIRPLGSGPFADVTDSSDDILFNLRLVWHHRLQTESLTRPDCVCSYQNYWLWPILCRYNYLLPA